MQRSLLLLATILVTASVGCKEQAGDVHQDSGPDPDSGPDSEPDPWPDTCFAAGTRIATPAGPTPIEAVHVGMAVYAYDTARAERVVREVTAVHVRANASVGRLTLSDGVSLRVTPSHPVYSPGHGTYRPVSDMRPHDTVLSLAGDEPQFPALMEYAEAATVEAVYNITVSGEHNYFAEGVLVHNKSYVPPCLYDEAQGGFSHPDTAMQHCNHFDDCTLCDEAVDATGEACRWLIIPGWDCQCPDPEPTCPMDAGVDAGDAAADGDAGEPGDGGADAGDAS
jgi:hypothetical protein